MFEFMGQVLKFIPTNLELHNRLRINYINVLLCMASTLFAFFYRSPNAYKDLRDAGYLVLPSQRILRYHKNKVKQNPGNK